MSKPLSIDRAVDKHLKPVKDSDGTMTALEVSTDDVRVKNLEVSENIVGSLKGAGSIKMNSPLVITHTDAPQLTLIDTTGEYVDFDVSGTGDLTISSIGAGSTNSDITLDADGAIYLNSASGNITALATTASSWGWSQSNRRFRIYGSDGGADFLDFICAADGVSTISTTDSGAGTDANLTLDADGDIILDSATGVFIAKNNGTEFSVANSAYAGMMIGCTHVFGSGTGGVFIQTSTAWENLVWDTDKYALVTFVVPPSNKVKISVHLPYVAAVSYEVRLGLATDSSATTLHTKYENDVDNANRADSFNLNYSWVVEGSDHSWSAGETKTLYIMAYTANNVRWYTGGTNTSGYGGVIVEATALPAAIGDGSEP